MLLYLVQHAEAKKEEEDPARGLTDRGFREITLMALFAQDKSVSVNSIRHSGKKRAAQTAQVLADKLRPVQGVSESNDLAPMDDPALWAERLGPISEDIMLVGHMPHLEKLASLLLCGDRDRNIVNFRMAGMVCLKRFDDGHWAVEWMAGPEMAG